MNMNNEMHNQLRDLFISIREGDNRLVYLSDCIADVLSKAREAGVSRESAMKALKKWNTNTEDKTPIRSQSILNRWMRKAKYVSTTKSGDDRKERSDKGVIKKDKETRDQAIARIKTLMAQHGITAKDLA